MMMTTTLPDTATDTTTAVIFPILLGIGWIEILDSSIGKS